ncbi:hypothetical protein IU500_24465 [Nocardia terpenica]|uniref:toxin-antitoxin system YwqK family antitoxin n=1 Tax=Nocardia terpenica TaxID=455432 RepID=UPI001893B9FE|nr:hypothetical protein [Nocardia terpenica]MBF6063795.1 hypothetical protein [Nocardia terpenica]MBF6107171.1 hypothetical protein [Nocardia terpenica]MBF6114345.1 hypothetical protein [Nocardia terpenica]MBF6121569.1 hypothetical protein [Nocardia terpenica]MBF6153984.1 hypothetical protein [Nocardia terpenica]
MTKRINANFDPVSWDDDLRLEYQGEPFTGEVVETLGDQLLSQEFYVNGIPHGPNREWWSNGTLKLDGQARHGLPYGVFRTWHENGQLASEQHFSDDGQLHTVLEWDENGNPMAAEGSREV